MTAGAMTTTAQGTTSTTSPQRRGVWVWLYDRAGLDALAYAVPAHANRVGYVLGGMSFVGFLVLALTGFWLAQFYDPVPDRARDSVLFIQDGAALGALVRGIHFWVANIVVVIVVLHMVRVFATGSFKIPRELNWVVGALLLAVTIGFAFTGTVLKWDQEAFEALEHNFEIATILGGLGSFFSESFTEAVPPLARLYASHVSTLPLVATLLFVAHFFLVKHHGISPLPEKADAGEAPGGKVPDAELTARYSTHLARMVAGGLALSVVAAVLGLVFAPPIGAAPDPAMEVTKPPFFFYWLYALEDVWGVKAILYGSVVFGLVVLAVPFVDRSPWRGLRRRRVVTAVAAIVLLLLVALSLYVFLAPPAAHAA